MSKLVKEGISTADIEQDMGVRESRGEGLNAIKDLKGVEGRGMVVGMIGMLSVTKDRGRRVVG